MKKIAFFSLLGVASILSPVRAEYLYNGFLIPSFDGQPNSEYSAWDVFYAAYNAPNYPDIAAPNGTKTTASAAGFTMPSANAWSPSDPQAYWNVNNATITQTGTSSAFIIGAGSAGNIYSFAAPTSFTLADTTAYNLGTVLFQFQTEGTMVNFSSIKLQYTDTLGAVHLLSPEEMLREYRTSGSAFGGLGNRTSVEWDLSSLNVTSYQILWSAQDSSTSFQIAELDTSATATDIIPETRTWNGGSGSWGTAGAWSGQTYTSANDHGNIAFTNTTPATVALDTDHTVGEIKFGSAASTTLTGQTLNVYTGVSTAAGATGTYTINSGYNMGAFNVFDIEGGTVQVNGVISGAYGLLKEGDGLLVLANNNTFTDSITVQGGTLRVLGTNAYTGGTGVLWGTLDVAADAGTTGSLGASASAITVGADSATFTNVVAGAAALTIAGDHTISRDVALANGTYQKTLGAHDTTGGATFSGTINIGTADNVHLSATNASDKVTFTGAMGGGSSSQTVTVDGLGTVVYGGAATKNYASTTTVASGTLLIASGTSFTGNGNWTVNSGGTLRVNGTLGGTGSLAVSGALAGAGTVSRAVTTSGLGSVIRADTGNLTLASLNSASGVTFQLTLGDTINVSGLLTGSSAAGAMQFLFLNPSSLQTGVTYTLLNYGSASGLDASDFNLLNNGLVLNSAFGNNAGWNIAGNAVQVQFSAVPEPSTWALLGLGASALGFTSLRRKIS